MFRTENVINNDELKNDGNLNSSYDNMDNFDNDQNNNIIELNNYNNHRFSVKNSSSKNNNSFLNTVFTFFSKKDGDDLKNKITNFEKHFNEKISYMEEIYLIEHKRINNLTEIIKKQQSEIKILVEENKKLCQKIKVLETNLENKLNNDEIIVVQRKFSKEIKGIRDFFSSTTNSKINYSSSPSSSSTINSKINYSSSPSSSSSSNFL